MTILPLSPELSHVVISYATLYLHCVPGGEGGGVLDPCLGIGVPPRV